MSDFGFVGDRSIPTIRFEVAPVLNALSSLCMLVQDLEGISSWVTRESATLTDEERTAAERACDATAHVGNAWNDSFPQWLDALSSRNPAELFRTDLERLHRKAARDLDGDIPDVAALAADRELYLATERRLCEAHEKECDLGGEGTKYDAMKNGSEYRDETVMLLRGMWDRHLKDEWPKVVLSIEESVMAFRSISTKGSSVEEKVKFVTEREYVPDEWLAVLESVDEVVFVPSVHIGPYMSLFHHDESTAWMVGRARIPEGAAIQSSALGKSELLMRLDALSDGSRLEIIELAAKKGEITNQDVIDSLRVSQSSASRHLTQLAATGLLHVDASERTKRYRVNTERVDEMFQGVKRLFGSR